LSLEKFKWKTTGQYDKLSDLFDDNLVIIHISGHTTTKKSRIDQLKSVRFVYNHIEQKEALVKCYGNTAVLVGRMEAGESSPNFGGL
jgi:hypothetical protein